MDSRLVQHPRKLRSINEARTDDLLLAEMIEERAALRATPGMDHCRDLLLCKRNARSVYMRKLCSDTMYIVRRSRLIVRTFNMSIPFILIADMRPEDAQF